MASWTDGPEYAPVERPAAFAAPVALPLDDAPPRQDLSAGAPVAPPTAFEQPRDPVPALAALAPSDGPHRDPQSPFQVQSAIVTAGSAWGAAHSAPAVAAPNRQASSGPVWTADQPYTSAYSPPAQATGFPAPGTPQWFGPGADWAPPAPRVPATLANAVQASTYGLLIVLAVGGLVTLLSPFLLGVGLELSSQVGYRRSQVRLAFIVALGVSLASGAVPIATGQGIDAVMGMVGVVSLLACWVMIAVVTFLQYTALAAGERPDAAY